MDDRAGKTKRAGFTLLDGAALVLGSAVAGVHLRGVALEGLGQQAWALFWLTFAGVALTAAGPFVFLARSPAGRPTDGPCLGDRLWGLLGLPWIVMAPLRAAPPAFGAGPSDLYGLGLGLGVAVACLTTLAIVWKTWVAAPPCARADRPTSWTDRVGLVLAVAWPIQCGFALVLTERSALRGPG